MEYTLAQLIRFSKKDKTTLPIVKMAIIGNDSTQHLKNAVVGTGMVNSLNIEVYDADYNQIEYQIFSAESEMYLYQPDVVLLSMCLEKLYEEFVITSNKEDFANMQISKIKNYHTNIYNNCNAKIIQFLFVEDNDRVFGNYGLSIKKSFIYQIKKLNYLLMEYAAEEKKVFLVDLNDIRAKLGTKVFFDKKFYCSAKMSISPDALPYVAKQVVDVIKAIRGISKKCVVLDLDNTLWGGIIGDDGMDGIELGELGVGYAFTEFQNHLKELKERGILLCVCSKNNEDIAKEPFINHPDMILKLDDITMFVANWEDKVSNIKYIQETLNIGMDSLVFVDDNPFERNLVKEMISDITVPEMPEDPVKYCEYFKSLNLFETASFSDNDIERTKQYRQEVDRNSLMKSAVNYDEYLLKLEMIGEVNAFEKYYYPRIAQLTQRSNQFNLRTIRYTEADIEKIATDDRYITLSYTLKDKFGDNGLVAVVILEKQGDNKLFINEWLMSCRVLRRGMEEFVVNEIVETAKINGFSTIIGEYIKTKKNMMVEHIYEDFGFQKISDNLYEMRVSDYKSKKHFINKEN